MRANWLSASKRRLRTIRGLIPTVFFLAPIATHSYNGRSLIFINSAGVESGEPMFGIARSTVENNQGGRRLCPTGAIHQNDDPKAFLTGGTVSTRILLGDLGPISGRFRGIGHPDGCVRVVGFFMEKQMAGLLLCIGFDSSLCHVFRTGHGVPVFV